MSLREKERVLGSVSVELAMASVLVEGLLKGEEALVVVVTAAAGVRSGES
jgi:hypothetical protein